MLDLKKFRVAVTGSAGFIGFHVTRALLSQGNAVCSFDSINDYYDPRLKMARLDILAEYENHSFQKGQLEDRAAVDTFFSQAKPDIVIHLAAQAGVRYSIINPQAYIDSNITGFQNILDASRKANLAHLVYASSSSVYGANGKLPFSEKDSVEHPLSFYAATKKANELMAHTTSNIYGLPVTGLRFFTAYGPWGRPDMAYFSFTKAILNGDPIDIFNHGDMRRDFTYIDDIVSGVISAACSPPVPNDTWNAITADPGSSSLPWKIYNLGNNMSVRLMDMIGILERELGVPAKKNMRAIQPGDVLDTYADITLAKKDLGFAPSTNIEDGLRSFVAWYRDYYKV